MTPKCCGPVTENHALGNKFFVCKTCKKEVFPSDADNQKLYDEKMSMNYQVWQCLPYFEQLELFDLSGQVAPKPSTKE